MSEDSEKLAISLYGDDAEWFYELKSRVTERRGGHAPSNSEVVRMMMTQFDPDASFNL